MFLALKAHNLVGCSGVSRSDFKFFNQDNEEINDNDIKLSHIHN